jgi:hyaluronoglucosaminidase
MGFAWRGVVEGFYGPPYSHEARIALVEFIGALGMNAYVYAPKDDPLHRAAWRDSYPPDRLAEFGELAERGRQKGVRVAFAISPGLDIDYESMSDRAALHAKCASVAACGIDWFVLALDDIAMEPGLGPRQASVANQLLAELTALAPATKLTVCPTEYLGVEPSPYLGDLAAALDSAIGLMWTGPTVCSPVITAADASAWCAHCGDHEVLLWDNFPVNDAVMADRLHLGPYAGRDPQLAEILGGVLCNPMSQPVASRVPLHTAAAFLRSPQQYDPDAALRSALEVIGDAALAALAYACADGPMRPPDRLELHLLVDALETEADSPGWPGVLAEIDGVLRTARDAARLLTTRTDALAIEVAPWADQLAREVAAGRAACRLVQATLPIGVVHRRAGRAAPVVPAMVVEQAFLTIMTWREARAGRPIVYGPRFGVYPAVVGAGEHLGIDVAAAVLEDANAVDRLCRLGLALADATRRDPPGAVSVYVDGAPRPMAADGTFDGTGEVVLVRSGRKATRILAQGLLPCADARLR